MAHIRMDWIFGGGADFVARIVMSMSLCFFFFLKNPVFSLVSSAEAERITSPKN